MKEEVVHLNKHHYIMKKHKNKWYKMNQGLFMTGVLIKTSDILVSISIW